MVITERTNFIVAQPQVCTEGMHSRIELLI